MNVYVNHLAISITPHRKGVNNNLAIGGRIQLCSDFFQKPLPNISFNLSIYLFTVAYSNTMPNTTNGSIGSGSGEQDALLLPQNSQTTNDDSHRLVSHRAGASEVEQLAHKIQHRRQHRLLITFDARVQLLEKCQEINVRQEYDSPHKISRQDLIELKQHHYDSTVLNNTHNNRLLQKLRHRLGLQTTDQYLQAAFQKALDHTARQSEAWFWFHEWTFFYTKVVSPWPWMRNETANAVLVVLLFFTATPLFFCSVLQDKNVCGDPSTGINWLEGYYMASVTLVRRVFVVHDVSAKIREEHG